MKRSVLLSLMVIGAAVSIVVGATTLAAFTATGSSSGEVTAGNLTIVVDNGAGGSLTFGPGDAACPDPIAPGDACIAPFFVENTGSVWAKITAVSGSGENDLDPTCANALWTAIADPVAIGEVIPPGGTVGPFFIEGFLDPSAGNDCQDAVGTFTVEVTVESQPTPF